MKICSPYHCLLIKASAETLHTGSVCAAVLLRVTLPHGARLGGDELSAPWSARSFRAIHVKRLSVALQLAAAEEILDTVMLDGAAAAMATA